MLMGKQILLDALTHGFVTIDKLGLLIYDEGWLSFHYREDISDAENIAPPI